ncbi:MAG: Fic family protein [Saprospiraceae bacterium]|jgi:hypothetical protein|nr:Fic family protein [Saprospiraceae bacterium]
MANSARFSHFAPVLYGRRLPEEGAVVGYSAIIHALQLKAPLPDTISIVGFHSKKYRRASWAVYPKAYLPDESVGLSEMEALHNQLVFALKYEGINLLVFKRLTQHYSDERLNELVNIEPTGQYTRKIWFLIEWLSGTLLSSRADLSKKSYVKLVNESIQYTVEGVKSPRHLVINNLPGTVGFCPLVFRTSKLEAYIQADLANQQQNYLRGITKDILQRATAFLLLKDSKASFSIEGESPRSIRAARWGQVIGQSGGQKLAKDELLRLQQLVIENSRFVNLGYRQKGGFVGEHDRDTGEPIPVHISAKWSDIETLMSGLLDTEELLSKTGIDAVLSAAVIAFGFVFIHPFEDGNGRIHRYLIHYILSKKQFSKQGMFFPISAAILNNMSEYSAVLESYSLPLLDYIEWKATRDHNVEVLNDTIDYYRYFDATRQTEFLYDCVNETIKTIVPKELEYLIRYDTFNKIMEDEYEMPARLIVILVKMLEQNNGTLSKAARRKEFTALTDEEVLHIEKVFGEIFLAQH